MVGDYVKNDGAEEDKRIPWQGYAGAVTTNDLDTIVIAVTVNDVFYDGGVILDSKHHAALSLSLDWSQRSINLFI